MGTVKNNPIKWSGSKAPLAEEIVKNYFPKEIETYYEPFCGSCAVMFKAIEHCNIKNIVCSDINNDLIRLWLWIKDNPKYVIKTYYENYFEFNNNVFETTLIEHRKNYYKKVRDKFNESRIPTDFLFLLRTCFNGLVRYNKKGEFNSPCHFTRAGITPDKLENYILETSKKLNDYDINFHCCSYTDITPQKNDFVFLDPPYDASKGSMYNGSIDENILIEWCNFLKCSYAMTYNGNRGNRVGSLLELENTEMFELTGKNSPYSRLKGDNSVTVKEILYFKK
jgi:DNA adenine methylase